MLFIAYVEEVDPEPVTVTLSPKLGEAGVWLAEAVGGIGTQFSPPSHAPDPPPQLVPAGFIPK